MRVAALLSRVNGTDAQLGNLTVVDIMQRNPTKIGTTLWGPLHMHVWNIFIKAWITNFAESYKSDVLLNYYQEE